MKDYQKTYKPFLLWIGLFVVVITIIPLCLEHVLPPFMDVMDLILYITVIMVDVLFYMVYKGEYVYWINGGPSFEEAKEAGSECRKEYAFLHLRVFLILTGILFIYALISIWQGFSMWIDFMVFIVGIIGAMFMTIPIKFQGK